MGERFIRGVGRFLCSPERESPVEEENLSAECSGQAWRALDPLTGVRISPGLPTKRIVLLDLLLRIPGEMFNRFFTMFSESPYRRVMCPL